MEQPEQLDRRPSSSSGETLFQQFLPVLDSLQDFSSFQDPSDDLKAGNLLRMLLPVLVEEFPDASSQ